MGKIIDFSEKNARGAWVVYGTNGIRQYYGYTKEQAERMYKEQAKREVVQFWNVKK